MIDKFVKSLLLVGFLCLSSLQAGSFAQLFAGAGDEEQEYSTEGNKQNSIEGVITSLAEQFAKSPKMKDINMDQRILITSFVELKNFTNTTEFGRVIGESLIHELAFRGFNVVEFRSQTAVSIDEQGEYFMSRSLNKLHKEVENRFILVGTYSRLEYRIVINARIVDNENGSIMATARAVYEHGLRNDCQIFNECKPPRKIQLVGGQ